MKILGISAYYHDSAAAIIENEKVVAAAQEERFTRIKQDESFPTKAIEYCLKEACLELKDLDAIVFYDKPFLKFERLLQTYFDNAPKGWWQFISAMPGWLKEKLFIKDKLKKELAELGDVDWKKTKLLFSKHHLSHAASSFFASNYLNAAILTIDGVGEWATASIAIGENNTIRTLKEMHYPHSLGLFYSAFTYFLGFKVNSGEYKVMGLAPYADPEDIAVKNYVLKIKENIIEIYDDGSIHLNQAYFNYSTTFTMINEKRFEQLFECKKRDEDVLITEQHYQIAQALQIIVQEVVIKMAKEAKRLTGSNNLCLAGGVALNCVANGLLFEQHIYDNIYVQPASGDAGTALGAAWAAYYMHFNNQRVITNQFDNMQSARLGPSFSQLEIRRSLEKYDLHYEDKTDEELIQVIPDLINSGKIVALFKGRMEFGPRALGGRSILGNPMLKETQSVLNLKVKQRESFRPFAPIMLQEEFEKYFGFTYSSPYMLMVHKLKPAYRVEVNYQSNQLTDKINAKRSELPAITHIDYSARIQTVSKENDRFVYHLLKRMKELTGYGVLVNTSFNLRGEPIVCTPEDAIKTFLSTEIDFLILDNVLVKRDDNLDKLSTLVEVKKD